MGDMENAELGVTEVQLTAEGSTMFPFLGERKLKIHEFHRREVKKDASGFVKLAESNQMFVNEDNTILTFQGHPELNAEVARRMLEAAPSYMAVEEPRRSAIHESMGNIHDGVDLWRRVLAWVKG